jgi:hypothetical protein
VQRTSTFAQRSCATAHCALPLSSRPFASKAHSVALELQNSASGGSRHHPEQDSLPPLPFILLNVRARYSLCPAGVPPAAPPRLRPCDPGRFQLSSLLRRCRPVRPRRPLTGPRRRLRLPTLAQGCSASRSFGSLYLVPSIPVDIWTISRAR